MIIGITGPIGAGKDVAAAFIEKEFGFVHVSGGDIIREMLRTLELEPTKKAVFDFGLFLRTNYGAEFMLRASRARAGQGNMTVSAFRSIVETELIIASSGIVLYIDAPRNLRHKRVQLRSKSNEVLSDGVLFGADIREASYDNPLGGNLRKVKEMATAVIVNDGSLEEFYSNIRHVLQKFQLRTSKNKRDTPSSVLD